jgi:hypothetical protein
MFLAQNVPVAQFSSLLVLSFPLLISQGTVSSLVFFFRCSLPAPSFFVSRSCLLYNVPCSRIRFSTSFSGTILLLYCFLYNSSQLYYCSQLFYHSSSLTLYYLYKYFCFFCTTPSSKFSTHALALLYLH